MQRQFDMENEQDVRDLFDILPEWVDKIEIINGCKRLVGTDETMFVSGGILDIKGPNNTTIYRPVDKSKWIGCLCAFDDVEINKITQNTVLGILHSILPTKIDKYKMMTGELWEYCRPVKRSEIKFVEDND